MVKNWCPVDHATACIVPLVPLSSNSIYLQERFFLALLFQSGKLLSLTLVFIVHNCQSAPGIYLNYFCICYGCSFKILVVRKLAAQLVDPHRPGDFNQSLMELGATLCTPVNPSCSSCPVSGQCRALTISKLDKLVLITDYPAKSIKLKQRHEFSAVCAVEISGRQDLIEGDQSSSVFLLVKRPDEGLLAGLWEFPSVMLGKEADLTRRRKEMNHFLKKSFRLDPQKTCSVLLREDIGEFIHIFTHIRLKVYVELLIVHLKGLRTLLLPFPLFLCKCCLHYNYYFIKSSNFKIFLVSLLDNEWLRLMIESIYYNHMVILDT